MLSRLKKLPASELRGERGKSRDEIELPTGAVAMAPRWPWSVPAAPGVPPFSGQMRVGEVVKTSPPPCGRGREGVL